MKSVRCPAPERFPSRSALLSKKVCYKVSLYQNHPRKVVRHSFAYLSVQNWLVAGHVPFYVKIWPKLTHSLQKRRLPIRGVRVYPYPRVYPTRPVPAGMGRVWVDVLRVGSGTGTKFTGTGIPVFTRKERHFWRYWSYIECFFKIYSF